ncbi:hypothetical protein V6N11_035941 [Hibiscus sabdariffa]|uniref:Uncharacterized protein n=1 Tax=Hibiscus sabdariffa TaxID=183260 RepID=A0ABR2R8X0_9ROSI
MSDYEVGPNHSISVFNEALDWSLGEIAAAIKVIPMNWPCPETMLLKDFSDELLAVKLFLPSVRWSSAAKTASLEHALKDCRLPHLPNDFSLLQSGFKMGKDIDNHRLLLESQSSNGFSIGGFQVYQPGPAPFLMYCSLIMALQDSLKLRLEIHTSPYCLSHPSPDEIIEVGCSPSSHRHRGLVLIPNFSNRDDLLHCSSRGSYDKHLRKSTNEDDDSSQKHRLAIIDDVCTSSKPNRSDRKSLAANLHTKQRDQWEQKNQVGQLEAGPWLFSKIVSSAEDNNNDDLAKTPHSLLIWKKWVPSLSVPPDSCLPLMVLSGSYYVDGSNPSSVIVNELGLHDIDKSRVSAFLVVFLAGKQHSEGSTGFFSDEKLREGLKWLANESPLQPVLSGVKMHEHVTSHLSPVLEELGKMSDYEVGPNHCISVFNKALDWLMGEIAAAIKANPMNWPCPETMLLKDFSNELLAVRLFLPSVQWSSTLKTASLEHTLKECQLSCFPDDISLLQSGPKMGKDIDNHRLLLENCLVEYLTQSTKMTRIQLS